MDPSTDPFDRDGIVRDAIALSRVPLSTEQLLEQEPRVPVLDLHLSYYRAHRDALLVPPDVLRGQQVGRLATRIGVRATLAAIPPQALRPIERPQIVVGLPRTGTTLLFNLLALRDGVRAPRLWELLSPVPPPKPGPVEDPRVAQIEQSLAQIDALVPQMRRIHALVARAPEECTFAMRLDFLEEDKLFTREIPAVAEWIEAQDFDPFYRFHRTILQLLALEFPPMTWVLKSPFHVFHLPQVLGTYPDAELVFTHRRPSEVVSSSISLLSTAPSQTWRGFDPSAVAPGIAARLAAGWQSATAAREQAPPGAPPAFDCRYEQLVADPIGMVEAIEAHFGRAVSPEAKARMQAFIAGNPKNKHGKHEHSLAQYGLSEADVERMFASYTERYLA